MASALIVNRQRDEVAAGVAGAGRCRRTSYVSSNALLLRESFHEAGTMRWNVQPTAEAD
jgi:hypothetical protein